MTVQKHLIAFVLMIVCLFQFLSERGYSQAQAAPEQHMDIVYATVEPGRDLHLDIYMPGNSINPPLVVWVHGGAWHSGSRSDPPKDLLSRGFALASIEYRLSPEAAFPAQIHDIKAAIRFLRANRELYGYDSSKIAIWGSSAGGHLAALVGTTNGHSDLEGELGNYPDTDSSVQATVNFFGPTNFLTILDQSTPHGLSVRQPALALLLGRPVDQVPDLASLASPVYHVDESDPPMLIMHGDQDYQVPVNQSLELNGAFEELDLDVELVIVQGGGHSTPHFFSPGNIDRVDTFLTRVLNIEP